MSAPVGGLGPCVGLLKLASIAVGIETTDALSKEAAVDVVEARSVSPGKFLILFTGPVEEVTSALRRGLEIGADFLIDRLFIPNLEPTLYRLIRGDREPMQPAVGELHAVGLIETLSVASTIRAADIAAKTASMSLVTLELAKGIGGKSWVAMTGDVAVVEAAVEAGSADAEAAGLLVARVVIPRPHGNLRDLLDS